MLLAVAALGAFLTVGCGGHDEATSNGSTTVDAVSAATDTPPPATLGTQRLDQTDTESRTAPRTGSDAEDDDAPIVVIDDRGVEVTIESTERIIPADGDLAEIVFALGLGDQVVATDLSATYPLEADEKPEIGYQRALATEPILQFEPSVVLATDIAGPPETLDDLERLGVPVVIIPSPATPEGPGIKIRAVAAALGVGEMGEALADDVDASIAEVVATAPRLETPPTVLPLYVRGENTQLVLGTDSSIHWLIEAAGGHNVAADLGVTDRAPINIEALIELAPDVIVIPSAGLGSVGGLEGLLELPGFAEMPAGENRRVLAYDDQYLLGNGPRTPALLAEFVADLHRDDGTGGVADDSSTDERSQP